MPATLVTGSTTILTESLARKLLIAGAKRHQIQLTHDARSIELPTSNISTDQNGATISSADGIRSFSARDSVELALFVVRLDEALSNARGDAEERHGERLLQALWAIEHLTTSPNIPGTWRRLRTTAGMIAAGWEVGMVTPPLPARNKDLLKVSTMLRIDRFRGHSDLFGWIGKGGVVTILATIQANGATSFWSGPVASPDFMEAIRQLPRSDKEQQGPASQPHQ